MRSFVGLAAVLAVGGCSGSSKDDCLDTETFDVWVDGDGDGYGAGAPERACAVADGFADNALDCDDADDAVHPEAEEACNGRDDDCDGSLDDGFASRTWYTDADGDGFGVRYPAQVACDPPGAGWVSNTDDCDDADDGVFPGGSEVCNGGVDDDCDGLVDDADPGIDQDTQYRAWRDFDLDGYGDPATLTRSCEFPTGLVENGDDCDDTRAETSPEGDEVCNGRDDDCDEQTDDEDPSVDPSTQDTYWADDDGDGFGNPDLEILACGVLPGIAADNPDDCDDTEFTVAPNRLEQLCDSLDNDCDPSTTDDRDGDVDGYTICVDDCDDARADVNPAAAEAPDDGTDQNCNGLEGCFADADNDGTRTDTWVEVADPQCNDAGNGQIEWPVDCDDADPASSVVVDWFADGDGDGWGAGPVVVSSCFDPGPGVVPVTEIEDCDDTDDTVHPDAVDVCYDGADTDCDGRDTCATCQDWLVSDGASVDGIYPLEIADGVFSDAWCDMTTDGGGWTLVASTAVQTLDDDGGNWHADLTTLSPAGPHTNIWDGLRPFVVGRHDLRFACKLDPADAAMEVDLSFHGVPWYTEITSGTEAQSCFNELDGQGQTPQIPPERVNNLTGQMRPEGDQWNAGYLEGEDSCGDNGDFTVDFDDRGMDSNQMDGTDWGEDDSSTKCGASVPQNGAWFVFLRE